MNALQIHDGGRELSPQVLLLRVSQQRMRNNSYLVVDPASRLAVVIDPAWQMDKIEAALANTGSTLSGILVTHAHFDHVDLVKPLANIFDCPIWMSRQEIEASGFDAPQLIGIDETPWFVGAMRIQPVLTPGHTPGCICYQIGDNLFSGDVLFAEGCGICDSVAAAYEMFESLRLLQSRLAPHTRIYPGHTYLQPPGQRLSDLYSYNIYLHFTDKHSFAAFRLRKGQNIRNLMKFI